MYTSCLFIWCWLVSRTYRLIRYHDILCGWNTRSYLNLSPQYIVVLGFFVLFFFLIEIPVYMVLNVLRKLLNQGYQNSSCLYINLITDTTTYISLWNISASTCCKCVPKIDFWIYISATGFRNYNLSSDGTIDQTIRELFKRYKKYQNGGNNFNFNCYYVLA